MARDVAHPLHHLFHPRGIAIVGASGDLSRIGGHPLKALRNAGYKGGVYPVNPKYPELNGFRCYPSIAAIDGVCDLAVVAVPARAVAQAIRELGAKGIPFAVVLTAGFREMGPEGRTLEAELSRAAREANVRMVGPNCQGLMSAEDKVYAVFGSVADTTDLKAGELSMAFQSGGFGYAISNLTEANGVGLRTCVSTGNETDLTTADLLSAFIDDPGTRVSFAYIEGLADGRALMAAGRKGLAAEKPVLVWKGGQSDTGRQAAQSHTANLAGANHIARAALRQSGIIEVDDVEQIVDIAKVFAPGRLPAGNRVGVLSISGGSGIVFADRAHRDGLVLPPFGEATLAALKQVIPAFGSFQNPADTTAGVFNDMSLMTKTMQIVLDDPGIDMLAVLIASISGKAAVKAVEPVIAAAGLTKKPVVLGWSGRRTLSEEAYAAIEAAGVPSILTPVRCASALAALARFATDRRRILARPPQVTPKLPKSLKLPAGAATLSEAESKAVLAAFGVPVTREVLVAPGADPVAAAKGLRFPLAAKIVSRDIPHKTEAGGVRLGIADARALADAVAAVTVSARRYAPAAHIDGVLVAEMADGIEMLVGATNDVSFGPAVTLGLGGVLAEALGDVAHRIAPFGLATAREMIAELKAAKILAGWRGKPAADLDALAGLLVRVSEMAAALGPRLGELDVNPVLVGEAGQGVVAADALLVLQG